MTYSVSVREQFIAQHHLTVPNVGDEGRLHSHTFDIQTIYRGDNLGEHGYLLDIDKASKALSRILARYRDDVLNDHLEGNPSCERLAAKIHADLRNRVDAAAVEELEVVVHEDDTAAVTFTAPL